MVLAVVAAMGHVNSCFHKVLKVIQMKIKPELFE